MWFWLSRWLASWSLSHVNELISCPRLACDRWASGLSPLERREQPRLQPPVRAWSANATSWVLLSPLATEDTLQQSCDQRPPPRPETRKVGTMPNSRFFGTPMLGPPFTLFWGRVRLLKQAKKKKCQLILTSLLEDLGCINGTGKTPGEPAERAEPRGADGPPLRGEGAAQQPAEGRHSAGDLTSGEGVGGEGERGGGAGWGWVGGSGVGWELT